MASKYSEQYSDRYAEVPSSMPRRADADVVKAIYAKYDLGADAAVLATTDTLFLCKIPKGARVIDALIKFGDLGTTGVVDIGWQASSGGLETADADGLFAAVDMKTAADSLLASNSVASPVASGKLFLEEVAVVAVPSEATSASDGDIELVIWYI